MRILEEQWRSAPPPKTPSPTQTEILHPGYPYHEHTKDDHDLSNEAFKRPYLAMKVDRFSGDPRIYGRNQVGAPIYDEGPLEAQPYKEDAEEPITDDFEEDVTHYPFGEEAYLDTQFLQAVGALGDRGLAGDLLRICQCEGEFRHLEAWDKHLGQQERNLLKERGEFFEKRRKLLDKQAAAQKRLKKAKAASDARPPGRAYRVWPTWEKAR